MLQLLLTSYTEKWTLNSVSLIMADAKETKCAVLSQVRFLSFEIQATYLWYSIYTLRLENFIFSNLW